MNDQEKQELKAAEDAVAALLQLLKRIRTHWEAHVSDGAADDTPWMGRMRELLNEVPREP